MVIRNKGFKLGSGIDQIAGLWPGVDAILGEDKNCLNGCYGKIYLEDDRICIIKITSGDLVLRSLKKDLIKAKFGVSDVKLTSHEGSHVTILDQLTEPELYSRIKVFYREVLKHCPGKTPDEQSDFLFGPEERTRRAKLCVSLKEGAVEASEEYILSLGNSPSAGQIGNLCKQIKQGLLEYADHSTDEYAVMMIWYAEELDSRM